MTDTTVQYYIFFNNIKYGPYNQEKIKSGLASKAISFDTFIWKKGLKSWIKIGELEEFSNRKEIELPPPPPISQSMPPIVTNTIELKEWYLFDKNENKGPYSKNEIINMLGKQAIRRNTNVFKKGMSGWQELIHVNEFEDYFQSVAPSEKVILSEEIEKSGDEEIVSQSVRLPSKTSEKVILSEEIEKSGDEDVVSQSIKLPSKTNGGFISTVKCPACDFEVNANSEICGKCGGKLDLIASNKPWGTTFILCWLLGFLGVHRFYTGYVLSGFIQLFTLGGLGIWTLIDWILLASNSFRDKTGKRIIRKKGELRPIIIGACIFSVIIFFLSFLIASLDNSADSTTPSSMETKFWKCGEALNPYLLDWGYGAFANKLLSKEQEQYQHYGGMLEALENNCCISLEISKTDCKKYFDNSIKYSKKYFEQEDKNEKLKNEKEKTLGY